MFHGVFFDIGVGDGERESFTCVEFEKIFSEAFLRRLVRVRSTRGYVQTVEMETILNEGSRA